MKQELKITFYRRLPVKTIMVLLTIVCVITASLAFRSANDRTNHGSPFKPDKKDSVQSVKAFMKVYKVLMSPRCMNCHPAGDAPLQGDDSHIHTMDVVRGPDGKGMYAARCSNCHQPANTPGLHTPPGNPKWQLPPSDMKMVFQGRTARQLALQIMNYNLNGHKNKEQLIVHVSDTLVKAAWNMGEGRLPPPMSYTAFVKVWDDWINKGGYAPKN
jgi:mono/diheme cytochrome c family protein